MISQLKLKLNNKILIGIAFCGFVLLCSGIYIGTKVFPEIVTNKIWETKILKENTEQWDMFMKMPFPFTFKICIFDVQNPDAILQGEKPVVKEAGPYVYKVYKWKSEVEWQANDISYHGYMRFEFDQQASGKCAEEDMVTILNTPYNTMLLTVEATQPSMLSMLESVTPGVFGENDGLFIKVKVKDYLFDGLKMCVNGGKDGGFASGMACKQIIAKIKETNNMRMVDNTVLFSNLYYKNVSHQGRFTIHSGKDNREETGVLKLFNDKNYISTWLGETSLCNKIRGVTTVFPAQVKKTMVFESFAEDICRAMALRFEEEKKVKGILGYKFVAANDSFSVVKEDNSCYCVNKSKTLQGEFGCLKNGLGDLTTCTGAPVLVSFPHLLHADPEYISSVVGLQPNASKHETFVTLEPISGFPLELAQRVQFNMFIRPFEDITNLENVTKAIVPLVWVEESTVLGDEYIDKLKNELFRNLMILDIVKWGFIGSGIASILLAFFLFIYMKAP
nr:sensory neuron membrane protein 2 [Monochamus saltuarius]